MGNLLKMEIFKLKKSFGYKVLMIICVMIGLILGVIATRVNPTARGADWVTLMGSGFIYNAVIISVYAADYIGSEFENHTFAAEISCGASRWKLSGAKMIVYFIGILPLILIYDLVVVIMLTAHGGFGMEWSADTFVFLMYKMIYSILCNSAMGAYILLIAYLVRRKIGTIGLGIGSLYLLNQCCINERNPKILKLWQFTFFYQIDSSNGVVRPLHTEVPFGIVIVSSLVAMCGMIFLSALIFRKSELK